MKPMVQMLLLDKKWKVPILSGERALYSVDMLALSYISSIDFPIPLARFSLNSSQHHIGE